MTVMGDPRVYRCLLPTPHHLIRKALLQATLPLR